MNNQEKFWKTKFGDEYRRRNKKIDKLLFKRDFAKEIWERFLSLKLIDYGFSWAEDPFYKKMSDNQG